jgi:tRNA dimethylallyltransferase
MRPKIVFLVGPTAIGKTDIALILAKKLNARIISCDSMQIYKGMDIITAKPSFNLRKRIPQFLIDIVSPTQDFDVSRYRKKALVCIEKILKNKNIPLFVGGTGLYVSCVIDGIFEMGVRNIRTRRQLYKEAETHGPEYLYGQLKKIDPGAAEKIHPHDIKRIVRALEVFRITGKPISFLQKQRKPLTALYDIKIFGLDTERKKLYHRIDSRVDEMFERGLLDEVRRLLKLKLSKTASFAIGIKELKGYFEGTYDLEEAKRIIKRNSRQYAKRQLTWFRKDKRIHWINIGGKEKPKEIADKIWKKLS